MKILLTLIFFLTSFVHAEEKQNILYLQPNITPLFTEVYMKNGLDNLPKTTFFEDAIYLDQSTPYTILPLQPSNQYVFGEASDVLSAFHKKMGDYELYVDPQKPKPFFYTASGSKHLIVALVYGIVNSQPEKKFLFVQQSPYYSGHPSAVTGIFQYPNARYQSFRDSSEIKLQPGEELVEFVTSPNNPDGEFRKPLSNAKIIIADFVFASSVFGSDGTGYRNQNIDWVRKARNDGKTVFSFNSASKQFGKTGARVGYIWYPLYDKYAESIFKKFFGFLSASTVAGGTIGLADFLDLIKALQNLPDTGEVIRKEVRKTLLQRHSDVEKGFMKRYPGSEIWSIPGSPTFFAKMHDSRMPAKRASDIMLEDLNVSVNSGDTMGETTEFIRLNLCGHSDVFADFMKRLTKEK